MVVVRSGTTLLVACSEMKGQRKCGKLTTEEDYCERCEKTVVAVPVLLARQARFEEKNSGLQFKASLFDKQAEDVLCCAVDQVVSMEKTMIRLFFPMFFVPLSRASAGVPWS